MVELPNCALGARGAHQCKLQKRSVSLELLETTASPEETSEEPWGADFCEQGPRFAPREAEGCGDAYFAQQARDVEQRMIYLQQLALLLETSRG